MIDPAKIIFDSFTDETVLVHLISQQVENLYIDYKTKRDHATAEVDKNLQEILSKAISGFANADGGVIVLGVDAPQGQTPTLKPIVPIVDFEQEVNTYVPRSTSFIVQGVQVKRIHTTTSQGGVVLIYVPKSDLSPHCSMKDKKYYQRNGDSFLAMEHYQIADMFGKRHHPHLLPYADICGDFNSATKVKVIVGVNNLGRAVARYPYLKLIDLAGFQVNSHGISGNGQFGLPRHPNPTNYRNYKGGSDDVIHPGAPLDVTLLEQHFSLDPQGQIVDSFQELILTGEIVADQFTLKQWKIVISRAQVQSLLAGRLQRQSIKTEGELL